MGQGGLIHFPEPPPPLQRNAPLNPHVNYFYQKKFYFAICILASSVWQPVVALTLGRQSGLDWFRWPPAPGSPLVASTGSTSSRIYARDPLLLRTLSGVGCGALRPTGSLGPGFPPLTLTPMLTEAHGVLVLTSWRPALGLPGSPADGPRAHSPQPTRQHMHGP